jgi:hypothetical protein
MAFTMAWLKDLGTSLWGYVSGQPNHLNVSSKKLFMNIRADNSLTRHGSEVS